MKYLFIAICVLCVYSFTLQEQYVKIELGEGFYYLGDSATNRILFLPSYKDTLASTADKYPRVVWPVVPKVESFGFNAKYIMATRNAKKRASYWIIDKTKDPNDLFAHEEGDRIALANVEEIDSTKFMALQKEFKIEIRPISYYRKGLDIK